MAGNTTLYRQNEPGSPLACYEQHQLCFTRAGENDTCTPLVSSGDLRQLSTTFLSDNHVGPGLGWLYNTTIRTMTLTFHPIANLGTRALMSHTALNGNYAEPLANDQWQQDVQFWHNTNMAFLQEAFIRAAKGPMDVTLGDLVRTAESPVEREICSNQVSQ